MPTVKEWHYCSEGVAVIFEDGFKAIFEPYLHYGNAEGFRRFILEKNNRKVLVFEGRLDRYTFVSAITLIDAGITQTEAGSYWRAAYNYFDEKYEPGGDVYFWRAWIYCVSEGSHYLCSLEENKASVKTDK